MRFCYLNGVAPEWDPQEHRNRPGNEPGHSLPSGNANQYMVQHDQHHTPQEAPSNFMTVCAQGSPSRTRFMLSSSTISSHRGQYTMALCPKCSTVPVMSDDPRGWGRSKQRYCDEPGPEDGGSGAQPQKHFVLSTVFSSKMGPELI